MSRCESISALRNRRRVAGEIRLIGKLRRARACAPVLVLVLAAQAHAGSARAGTSSASDAEEALEPDQRSVHLGDLAREPMLLEHPSGRLFVAGYGSQSASESRPDQVPLLLRSDDGGSSWTRVDVGDPGEGAIGNSDVDLALGPRGEIYFATMGFDRTTFRGTHVAVGVSHDAGESWGWHVVSRTEYDDRPWVVVDSEGTAHLVWNDGAGVAHAQSRDQGESWRELERLAPRGGSSHFAAGADGRLALRLSPLSASGNRFDPEVDQILVSTDAGTTWQSRDPPGQAAWPESIAELATKPRWVDPVAWVGSHLFHLWTEGEAVLIARSADDGRTWKRWELMREDEAAFFPYLAASPEGRLAASWWFGKGSDLRARIAVLGFEVESAGSGDAAPKWQVGRPSIETRTAPLELDMWRRLGSQGPQMRDTGGEYLPLLWLRSGELAAAITVQNPARERLGFEYWRFGVARP